jgi:3'(2'), 5'-bisphosphate nucleotidase
MRNPNKGSSFRIPHSAFRIGEEMAYEKELAAALGAAAAAGRVILAAYADFTAIPNARADISTEADRQAQETILTHLRGVFPEDALCAEEQTPALAGAAHTGPRLWVVDPIDGTRGFAMKNGEFSVMVGFVEEGQIALGVVLEPAAGRLTYAVRGGGSWARDGEGGAPVACRVTAATSLAEAALVQSRSRRPGVPSQAVRALAPARVRETYSAGIKLALVARGEADVYLNDYVNFHDWDICAGQILVAEAGGTVTGLKGEELRYGTPGAWQRQGLLATNGPLHAAALRAWADRETA